uniref:Uncharacterized protein n=1 Tax=Setaria viridis TaxID=4556 RepID=A0A4U6TSB1_SETVI|nr:hypothetical protein SEVIR_7G205350v2 [Setaria viridis]
MRSTRLFFLLNKLPLLFEVVGANRVSSCTCT